MRDIDPHHIADDITQDIAERRSAGQRSGFAVLGVAAQLERALAGCGVTTPTEIQVRAIPDALAGSDIAGEAPTGSGKTIAFGVPMLQRLAAITGANRESTASPRAMVVAPTRELARQILHTLEPLAEAVSLRVVGITGGVPFEPQIRALRNGADVLVATPGRLLDLVEQGEAHLGDVIIAVVDEADRLADLGFLPDLTRLLDMTTPERQTMLFSATLVGTVDTLIAAQLRWPARHAVAPPEMGPVRHHAWLVDRDQRTALLAEIVEQCGSTIAFCRTRHDADRTCRLLVEHGRRAGVLHGGNAQQKRADALDDFRSGATEVLVATDVAARGLHIAGVSCVVHVDLPTDPTDYVHRSGRTGRAGATGVVIAFVAPDCVDAAVRFLARVHAELGADGVGDAEITPPQVRMLETVAERLAIDRELATISSLVRPGSIGTVRFERPRSPTARSGG